MCVGPYTHQETPVKKTCKILSAEAYSIYGPVRRNLTYEKISYRTLAFQCRRVRDER